MSRTLRFIENPEGAIQVPSIPAREHAGGHVICVTTFAASHSAMVTQFEYHVPNKRFDIAQEALRDDLPVSSVEDTNNVLSTPKHLLHRLSHSGGIG